MAPSKIIINADDYGFNSNATQAIAYCFRKGLINSTTMMVNADAFDEALQLAQQDSFTDKIGLHLNLTEGTALTDLSGTTLTDADGKFIMTSIFNPRIVFSSFVRNKIRAEIRAQYDKLVAHGIVPTHIDSHQHVHKLPWTAPLFVELAKEKGQRIRIKKNILRKNLLHVVYGGYLNWIYKKHRINFSDRYESFATFNRYPWQKKTGSLVFEIGIHPGFDRGELVDVWDKTRRLEDVLTKFNQTFRRQVAL